VNRPQSSSNSKPESKSPDAPHSPASPPSSNTAPLWGRARHLLGWQGLTLRVPVEWNPGRVAGGRERGDLRIDDPDGARLELRWETPKTEVNIEKTVENFVSTLAKQAKKEKRPFTSLGDLSLVSKHKKGKNRATSFGWTSDNSGDAPCGYGVAWSCPDCKRVVVAHLLGQNHEAPKRVERSVQEILGSLDCDGHGGWDTWAAFELALDVPDEFPVARSQMLVSRLDLEWIRPRPIGLYGWGRRAERLRVQRFPVAGVLLEGKPLSEWADWNIAFKNKALSLSRREEEKASVNGHEALVYRGPVRDPRARISILFFDLILRRKTPHTRVLVWQCEQSNRIFAFESEMSLVNEGIPDDVLESLACH